MIWSRRKREDKVLPPLPIKHLPPLPPPAKETYMPVEYERPIPAEFLKDTSLTNDRDVVVKAAQTYDRFQKQFDDLRSKLDQAILGLEAKDLEIGHLTVQLKAEETRVLGYQQERDEAIDAKINAEARLADIKAIIDRAELPPPKQRRGRKPANDPSRPAAEPNNGGDLFEQAGGQAPVAEAPPVLAQS